MRGNGASGSGICAGYVGDDVLKTPILCPMLPTGTYSQGAPGAWGWMGLASSNLCPPQLHSLHSDSVCIPISAKLSLAGASACYFLPS